MRNVMRRTSVVRQLLPGWRWLGGAIAAGLAVAVGVTAFAQTINATKWNLNPHNVGTLAFDADGKVWAKSNQYAIVSLDADTNTLTAWTHENSAIFGGSTGVIGVQAEGGDPDRYVWAASTSSDHIDRLDTSTGEVLTWATSGTLCPQGVVAFDASGNAWFGTSSGRVERLDPNTNTLTTWSRFVSFAGCTDIIGIDGSGDVWYCGRNVSNLGKLNPATNEITEWDISGTIGDCHSLDAAGVVWFSRNTQEVLRLDGATNELTSWPCPVGCGNVSGVSLESNGTVWFGESGIDSLDTTTNQVEQYNSYGSSCFGNARPFIAPNGDVWTSHNFVILCRFTPP